MTFEDIRRIVETRMSGWSGAPIAYDGVPSSQAVQDAQANKTPWVRLSIQHGDSFTAGVSADPCVRRTGVIFVQVFTPDNQGSATAMTLADSVANRLEYYQEDHLATQAASLTRIGPENGWYRVNVSTGFRAG